MLTVKGFVTYKASSTSKGLKHGQGDLSSLLALFILGRI